MRLGHPRLCAREIKPAVLEKVFFPFARYHIDFFYSFVGANEPPSLKLPSFAEVKGSRQYTSAPNTNTSFRYGNVRGGLNTGKRRGVIVQ